MSNIIENLTSEEANSIEKLNLIDKDMLKLFIRLYELATDKSVIDNMIKQYSTPYLILNKKEL